MELFRDAFGKKNKYHGIDWDKKLDRPYLHTYKVVDFKMTSRFIEAKEMYLGSFANRLWSDDLYLTIKELIFINRDNSSLIYWTTYIDDRWNRYSGKSDIILQFNRGLVSYFDIEVEETIIIDFNT